MRKQALLTVAELKSRLRYDPISGLFHYLRGKRGIPAGAVAGGLDSYGYVIITIDRVRHRAHRLAWLYMTGAWPADEIDHMDGNRSNNSLRNLREASHADNQKNQRLSRANSAGFKGVRKLKKCDRWQAEIRANGVRRYLGLFKSPQEAARAYDAAARELHGRFANPNDK